MLDERDYLAIPRADAGRHTDNGQLREIIGRAAAAVPEARTMKLLRHLIREAPRNVEELAKAVEALESIRATLAEAGPRESSPDPSPEAMSRA
jgi:hypothetical protein